MKKLKGYAEIISGAIGVTDETELALVEDIMRNDIFHSTLDWQTKKQLEDAAVNAYSYLKAYRSAGLIGR